jgi:hypothetical protein
MAVSTDRTKAKDAATYRAAAKLLEDDAPGGYGGFGSQYSCDRLGQAAGWFCHGNQPEHLARFKALAARYEAAFKPDEPISMGWWTLGKDGRDCRILALCFMAAMVEAGDA